MAIHCHNKDKRFRMEIVESGNNSSCTISWNIGYIAESQIRFNKYSDQYAFESTYKINSYEYCVKSQQMYVSVDYRYDYQNIN